MTREEAIKALTVERESHRTGGLVESAIDMAISALRAKQNASQSPCASCGYGGKHLEAPPCCTCPAYPKEAEKNEPLTLDELRKMDGAPVWIVEYPDWGHWELSMDGEDYVTERVRFLRNEVQGPNGAIWSPQVRMAGLPPQAEGGTHMNENTRGRRVEMYGPDGSTILRFRNAKEAMEETGVDRRLIYACCKGRHSAWIDLPDGPVKFRFAEKGESHAENSYH